MTFWRHLLGMNSDPQETDTQRAIRRADAARDSQDWSNAAQDYRRALRFEDGQPHIWKQLGHALKESDRLNEALPAYQRATVLEPTDADAHLHLAHLYKQLGYIDLAIAHFLRSIHYGIDSKAEERELLDLIARQAERGDHAKIAEAIEALDHLPSGEEAPILAKLRAILSQKSHASAHPSHHAARPQERPMVFDVSDLIGFWRTSRLPTGIQRVQIEAIRGALDRDDERIIRLCCFTSLRDEWLEVPLQTFRLLCDLATSAGDTRDEQWIEALAELDLHTTLSAPFVFPHGALLINLGTSWWLQNYFLFVRQAKKTSDIRYIPFVHDMIPIVAPEHCIEGLTQDFISWALGVFDHADHFLVNSKTTANDLREVGAMLGHQVSERDIAVVPLDSDFRKQEVSRLHADALEKWQLEEDHFVLLVSTVESRKGHLFAFDAWVKLIEWMGADSVPQLVCVGNRGWLNDKVYERLATDMSLSRKVTMLSGLSDAELALLYRSCRFTIYPSLYEGWGLPVTESLCYGKVPLISKAASLPEAGGRFAVYFEAGNSDQLAAKAQKLVADDGYRAGLEATIKAEFAPRSWRDLAKQIVSELDQFASVERDATDSARARQGKSRSVARVCPGNWYPLTRNRSTRIWPGMSSAEKFRADLGWYWPEDRGCRVRKTGGNLKVQFEPCSGGLRLYIALCADENERTGYDIRLGDQLLQGWLEPDERTWVWFDLPAGEWSGEQTMACRSVKKPDGGVPTYFVRGFFPCPLDQSQTRQDFLEAVSLGRLDLFDAYRDKRDV